MNKTEFLAALERALSGLPEQDVQERLAFYGELIDDRVEEGLSEEEAVKERGSVDEIAKQTLADIPLSRLVKERVKPKRALRAWEIVLLVLGFPLWFPLLLAAAVVVLALYIVLWALVIALWAVEVSLWVCALGGIAAAVFYFVKGTALQGIVMLGAALVCAGLSIFLFFGCVAASKGVVILAKKIARGIKSLFVRKERVK